MIICDPKCIFMEIKVENKQINLDKLVSFIELLAKFDFRDNQKNLDTSRGSLDSAPGESLLLPKVVTNYHGAENTTNK